MSLAGRPFISVRDVTKVYHPGLPDEIAALRGVSVAIAEGDVAVIAGPSGSGKTSLLSLVGCMARPTAGVVTVAGRDVSSLPEKFLAEVRRDTFGFVFQSLHLLRELTVLENVALPLYPLAVGFREMRERAARAVGQMGISHRAGARAGSLSGGEQQRTAIARALVNDPSVVIADEPTAHLDRELSLQFLEVLRELNGRGKTVVIATHDPLVYEHPFVTRRISMRDGALEGAERS